MKNTKKVALITGASSGIGKELAYIHAKRGGNLVLVARRKKELESIKKDIELQYGVEVSIITNDLTISTAPQEIYDTISERGTTVDYLVNNAGFGGRGEFYKRDWNDDKNMIQLNIIALTELTRLFLPDMVKRNEGRILNVGSTASFSPGPLQAVYFATKSYVKFFSNAIAQELASTNVTVTNLMPGATATEFAKVANMEKTDLFKQVTSANSVAKDGYDAMMKGKLNCVSGLTFIQKIMIYMLPFMPERTRLKVIYNMQK